MLHDLAMAECRDLHSHGDYIPGAIDHGCFEAIGKATAIDSLAAVKHLIFDTKKLTWDQLLTAIEDNWEGHEAVRQMCLNAPKYGNGIEWVDAIGFEIETLRAGDSCISIPSRTIRPSFCARSRSRSMFRWGR